MITDILLALILIIIVCCITAAILIAKKVNRVIGHFLPPVVLSFSDSKSGGEIEVTKTWKYKFMMFKAYFDNGYSLTSYPKWVIATVGIGAAIQNYPLYYLFLGGLIYGILCFILGYVFLKFGFYEAQQEVANQFNLFVKEVRERKSI